MPARMTPEDKKILKTSDGRWPRILSISMAAAYCGMTLSQFKKIPELSSLIREHAGSQAIDRNELDKYLDEHRKIEEPKVIPKSKRKRKSDDIKIRCFMRGVQFDPIPKGKTPKQVGEEVARAMVREHYKKIERDYEEKFGTKLFTSVKMRKLLDSTDD